MCVYYNSVYFYNSHIMYIYFVYIRRAFCFDDGFVIGFVMHLLMIVYLINSIILLTVTIENKW